MDQGIEVYQAIRSQ